MMMITMMMMTTDGIYGLITVIMIYNYNDGTDSEFSRLVLRLFILFFSRLVGFIWDRVESLKSNDLTQQKDTLKVLRAARVLRPLKIVSGIPSE